MKTPHLIVGIDHVYLSVSDIARSESYYDRVFGALGFRKGNRAIAGERHAHYFGPRLQVSLRPARGNRAHDPYAPGLHHLCMQVATHADVDRVFSTLDGLGVAPTPPRLLPETGPDYYATFFQDPDGIRLEVVARTAGRAAVAQRWEDFEVFLNPLADLAGKSDGIFHIAAASDWTAAEALGRYLASSLQSEGYIHCSTRSQVVPSADAYFRGRRDLVLLQIDPSKLRSELRYEPPATMTSEIFPHVYGALNLDAVVARYPLLPGADGRFALPEALR